MSGFRKFLLRGNVIDLAIAVVIGAAFGTLIAVFTSSFITPLIAAIGGKPDFSSLYFTINGSKFSYGLFVNALIAFLILAAVIYFFVVAPVNRMMERYRPTSEDTKTCPECLSSIPAGANKCAFCTSPQISISVTPQTQPTVSKG
jgi:large conductance mechanosensitive channel